MAISPYVTRLRAVIGQELILLPSVTVLITDDRDRTLLARHVGSDRWGTIGGMVEPEEHPRAAAAREVAEETGLEVTIGALIAVVGGPGYTVTYPNGDRASYVSSVFTARVTGGSQELDTEELTAVRWFDRTELSTAPARPDTADTADAEHRTGAAMELDGFATALFAELGVELH